MNVLLCRSLPQPARPGLAACLTAVAAGKPPTFTGRVSDAMCGANDLMIGDRAACARACIHKGSKYALVLGDKV